MKKNSFLLFVLTIFATFTLSMITFADDSIKLIFDNSHLQLKQAPEIKDSRTFVPIRPIAEKLNFDVSWEPETKSILFSNEQTNLKMTVGSREYTLNGTTHDMDTQPYINPVNNTTYVPLRFLANAFNIDVSWNQSEKTVILNSKNKTIETTTETASEATTVVISTTETTTQIATSTTEITTATNKTTQSSYTIPSSRKTSSKIQTYPGTPIPDFGAYYGVKPILENKNVVSYNALEVIDKGKNLDEYPRFLLQSGFTSYYNTYDDDIIVMVFTYDKTKLMSYTLNKKTNVVHVAWL